MVPLPRLIYFLIFITTSHSDFFFPVLAILFNCSEPEVISEALEKISTDSDLVDALKSSEIVLGAYAHKLTPVDPNWTLAESETPQPLRQDLSKETYWEDFVEIWINKFGVKVVGGCCGITPDHIRHIRAKLDDMGR
jgi:S-methylmethionine-dependent homocysteine/selenocysteine methylase